MVDRRWKIAPTLGTLCGAFPAMFWATLAGEVISLDGLRYRFPLIDGTLAKLDRLVGIDARSW